jgi:hypothetical protein
MKLQVVAARHGVVWVRKAFALFFQRPMAFIGVFGACLFGALLLNLLPLIGPLLLLAALPLGSLAFMIATRAAQEGRAPMPGTVAETLRGPRARRMALLQLGVGYAVGTLAIMLLADWVDDGALEALLQAMGSGAAADKMAQALAHPKLELGMLVRFGLAGLLSVPFWHAPALVHWDDQPAAKALFFSTVACWRNKAAFAAYSLAWVAVILLFAVLVNLVFGLLGQVQMVALATLPATLIFSAVFYVSLYFSFADCFVVAPTEPAVVAE